MKPTYWNTCLPGGRYVVFGLGQNTFNLVRQEGVWSYYTSFNVHPVKVARRWFVGGGIYLIDKANSGQF